MKNHTSTLIAFILLFHSCIGSDFTEYVPTCFNGSSFLKCPDSFTKKHQENIEKVFSHYNISFKKENNRIFYKGNIDDETLWNYTTKANDTLWLNSHF